MKKTPYFSGYVKPFHVGVYERNWMDHPTFSFWDGYEWGFSTRTPKGAVQARSINSSCQYSAWRGLASNPKTSRSNEQEESQ